LKSGCHPDDQEISWVLRKSKLITLITKALSLGLFTELVELKGLLDLRQRYRGTCCNIFKAQVRGCSKLFLNSDHMSENSRPKLYIYIGENLRSHALESSPNNYINIHFCVKLKFTPRSLKSSLPLLILFYLIMLCAFLNSVCATVFLLLIVCLITLIIFCREYKLLV
jgi:hypothetical protein